MFRTPGQRVKTKPKKELPHALQTANAWAGVVGGVLLPLILFVYTCNTSTKVEGMSELLLKQDTLNRSQLVLNTHMHSIQRASNQTLQKATAQLQSQQEQIQELRKVSEGQLTQIRSLMELVSISQRQSKMMSNQLSLLIRDSVFKSDEWVVPLQQTVVKLSNIFFESIDDIMFSDNSAPDSTNAFRLGKKLLKELEKADTLLREPHDKNVVLLRSTKLLFAWRQILSGVYQLRRQIAAIGFIRYDRWKLRERWLDQIFSDFETLRQYLDKYFQKKPIGLVEPLGGVEPLHFAGIGGKRISLHSYHYVYTTDDN